MNAEDSYIFHPRYDFPPFAGAADAYLICSIPRAGGHYLCHLLWSTGSFGSPSEYFLAGFVEAWKRHYAVATEREAIRQILSHRTSPNGWFGAKVHCDQFKRMQDLALPAGLFRIRGYIFLTRRDIVAQAISRLIAHQTGQWISLDQKRGQELSYDRSLISKYIGLIHRDAELWRSFRDQLQQPFIQLTYEDLLADPQQCTDDIAKVLGVSGPTKISAFPAKRQADKINSEWIERYQAGK